MLVDLKEACVIVSRAWGRCSRRCARIPAWIRLYFFSKVSKVLFCLLEIRDQVAILEKLRGSPTAYVGTSSKCFYSHSLLQDPPVNMACDEGFTVGRAPGELSLTLRGSGLFITTMQKEVSFNFVLYFH